MVAITANAPIAAASSGSDRKRAARRVLPGFRLTLGYTLAYLSLIVLIPISALFFKTFSLTFEQFWSAVSSPRVMAAY